MSVCLLPLSFIWNRWAKYELKSVFKVVHSKEAVLEEQFETINGRRICYVRTGHGPHNVLCIPGFLRTWRGFEPQLMGLDQTQFTVVSVDPPGMGKSLPLDRKDPPEVFEEDARIMHALMKKLHLVPYSVIGWSDGGIAAIYMAYQQRQTPKAIRKLLLVGAMSYVSEAMIADGVRLGRVRSWPAEELEPLRRWASLDYVQKLWDSHESCYRRILKEGGNICNDLLKEIPNDVLIVHGAWDSTVPGENAWFLNENLPCSCGLLLLPMGGHDLHLEHPKWFNEIATQFLTSTFRCSQK